MASMLIDSVLRLKHSVWRVLYIYSTKLSITTFQIYRRYVPGYTLMSRIHVIRLLEPLIICQIEQAPIQTACLYLWRSKDV